MTSVQAPLPGFTLTNCALWMRTGTWKMWFASLYLARKELVDGSRSRSTMLELQGE